MGNITFYRAKKDRNYTVISNTFLKDTSLSLQAKGLFTILLSLPEDWNICLESLVNMSKGGMCSLRSAIKELEEHGYFTSERIKDEKGKFAGTKYLINENPNTDKPHTEKPNVENQRLLNTNIQNTKRLNTKIPNTKYNTSCNNSLNTPSCNKSSPENLESISDTNVLPEEHQTKTKTVSNTNISETTPSVINSSKTKCQTQNKNNTSTQIVSSTPASAKQKRTFSKQDYEDCRRIIYNNKKCLCDKGIQVEKAEYDIRFVNSKLKKLFESFGVEQTKQGLLNSVRNDWLISIGYTLNGLLSEKMFAKYIADEQSIHNDRYGNKPRYKVFEDKQRVYNDEEGRF